jgi:hypothetical protein
MEQLAHGKMGAWVPPEIATEAHAAARELNITVAEYIRRAVIHLAATRTNPFATPSCHRRPGRPKKCRDTQ